MIIGGPDVHQRIPLMQRLRSEFDVAAVGSEPALADAFSRAGFDYDVYHQSAAFDVGADLRSVVELFAILRSRRPDIVHCFDTKPAIYGRWAAALARVPVRLATLPGLGGLYSYDTPTVRRRRWLFDRFQFLADAGSHATVFQNRDDRALLIERGVVDPGRALVIDGSGVDASRFRPTGPDELRSAIRERLGVEGGPVVLFVGRWVRAKGVLDLIDALPALRHAFPGVRLVALGEPASGPDALTPSEIARVRAECVCPGVRSDVPDYLAAADLVVLPTRYREGVPRALLEAAASGCPIVTTDTPGCREVVDHGRAGWLVPPADVASLSRAILEALRHPDRAAAAAERARRHVMAKFELGRIAENHRTLYHRLFAASRSH